MRFVIFMGCILISKCLNQELVSNHATLLSFICVAVLIMDGFDFIKTHFKDK